jgi:L-fuconolactonase
MRLSLQHESSRGPALIDAHHHLWDPSQRDYPWMVGAYAGLTQRFDLAELTDAIGDLPVVGTVCVQAAADESETADLLTLASSGQNLVLGVVGWVDLLSADVGVAIDRLRSRPGGERLVGIRHQVEDEPDPDWLSRPEVVAGVRQIMAADLAFDLLVGERELPAALVLARSLGEGRLVIDHAAKPPIADGRLEPWADRLARLAEIPNVFCKMSGLVTESGPGWRTIRLEPYVELVLELFGPERLMLGSDWPVCTLSASYREAIDSVTIPLQIMLSSSERKLVWHDNACLAYGLDVQTESSSRG